MIDFAYARERMIRNQIAGRGLITPALIEAFRQVPREAFVEPGAEDMAYEDTPLSIGEGQTISQPFIVALMIDRAQIDPDDAVLEIGTGSGYAAAVLSRIASHVYTIERHPALAEQARRRFQRLGFHNIVVRVGDGTNGWPEAAPFDAIIVSAAAPSVPQPLKDQLAPGGCLIVPVGTEAEQRLVRVTHAGPQTYEEEDLGGVVFVPLVGQHGWSGPDASPVADDPLPHLIRQAAEPLPPVEEPAFGEMFDRFGTSRIVLLGEATHGTSEFYRARAAITRRLVEHHGFNIVAVEADWPDAAIIDRQIRQRPATVSQAPPFQRFPTWMWRNREFSEFIGWMSAHNHGLEEARRIGFYGLDIYNMTGSIASVLAYLERTDPDAARIARERYGCLTPWREEPSDYGLSALSEGYGRCEEAVVAQCRDLLERQIHHPGDGTADLFDASQNARLVAAAERYYRVMYHGGAEAWNLRDRHMFETLNQLLEAGGQDAKAVVWAHNSHIGDARHTDMGTSHGEINLGQLCREGFGRQAALIGFGTGAGEVAAATDWGGDMEIKTIRRPMQDSYEELLHSADPANFLLDFRTQPNLAKRLADPRLERFIGVVYRPDTERQSHYMYASLPKQFDAFLWFDRTTAVTPVGGTQHESDAADTFPFGL